MQIFYAPDIISRAPGTEYVMSADESRHAVAVLRLGAGASVRLVDGRGGMYLAQVVTPSPRGCVVRVVSCQADFGARGYRLILGVAPTKNGERMEWLLEKATEVGLDALVPMECACSERRVFRAERAARAAKVLVSAMKQSLKAYMPVLEPLTPFAEVVAREFEGLKLIAHCREEGSRVTITEALRGAGAGSESGSATGSGAGSGAGSATGSGAGSATGDVLILIGPEGDFTAEEVALAQRHGFIPISLGRSRLRTETAALVAATAVYLANCN